MKSRNVRRIRPRMLVVDPDMGTQAILAVTFGLDFTLDHACGVSDALGLVTRSSPDLLITAFSLPDLDAASLVLAVRARRPGCPVLVTIASTPVDGLRDLMALGIDGVFPRPLRLDALLDRAAALLWPDNPQRPRRLSPHVTRAVEHLSTHQTGLPNVTELAQAIGVSVSHLAHLFARDTGISVKEYLTRVRIEFAKCQLRDTQLKLDSIAADLGFCDASHLSRVFRKQTGRRPGDFRRAVGRG